MSNFIDKKEKKLCGGNSMENDKEYQKWLKKVTEDEYNLKSIPFEFRTIELCEIAVTQKGLNLEFVPKALRTKELCEVAVSNYGYALQYVPEDLRTFEISGIAVANEDWALQFVPEEFQEELAEKYDIDLPKKHDERGR